MRLYRKNARQLRETATIAATKGGKYRGKTAQQWAEDADWYEEIVRTGCATIPRPPRKHR